MLKFWNRFQSLSKSINTNFIATSSLITSCDSGMYKRKIKYDGRSKRRKWIERRTDKGKGLAFLEETSSTYGRDEQDNPETISNVPRIKKRKYAMLLGYSGAQYFGMQRNPFSKTIEEELFKALHKTEMIDEQGFEQVQNIRFQRAARTDKGVSAVRQVVSLKLPEVVDISLINKELPEDIRIFGIKRVTKGFNSKNNCDGRTYIYVLPTVAFSLKDSKAEQLGFRLDSETYSKINRVLSIFVGTKNYHNFTSKKSAQDPSASRFIKSFVCETPFIRNDVEFAVLKVVGQSFMLHQIRKMVCMVVAIIRTHIDESVLHEAFSTERVSIPRVPGLGLVLDYVHYNSYNNRYGEDGMHDKLLWEDVENEVTAFKEKYIYPTILNREIENREMLEWIYYKLYSHHFGDPGNTIVDENSDDEGDKDSGDEAEEEKEIDDGKERQLEGVV